jgi:hypothetical protein
MGTIKCQILKKDLTIKTIFVDSSRKKFDLNRELYFIPNEKINLPIKSDGKFADSPVLFYTEGNPHPVMFEENSVKKEEKPTEDKLKKAGVIPEPEDPEIGVLDDEMFENWITQASKAEGPSLNFLQTIKNAFGYAAKNPVTLVLGALALVIGYAILKGGI